MSQQQKARLFFKWNIYLKETDEGSAGLMVYFLRKRKKRKEKADQDSKLNLSRIYTVEAVI